MYVTSQTFSMRQDFGGALTIGANGAFDEINIPTNPAVHSNYATIMELLRIEMRASWDYANRGLQDTDAGAWGGMQGKTAAVPADTLAGSKTGIIGVLSRRRDLDIDSNSGTSLTQQWSARGTARFDWMHQWEWSCNIVGASGASRQICSLTAPSEAVKIWDTTDGAGNGLLVADEFLQFQGLMYFGSISQGNVQAARVPGDAVAWLDLTLVYRMRNVTIPQMIAAVGPKASTEST